MSDKDATDEEIIEVLLEDHDARACRERMAHLERAVLLLAKHVGAVGWNYELQKALDGVRDDLRTLARDKEC